MEEKRAETVARQQEREDADLVGPRRFFEWMTLLEEQNPEHKQHVDESRERKTRALEGRRKIISVAGGSIVRNTRFSSFALVVLVH